MLQVEIAWEVSLASALRLLSSKHEFLRASDVPTYYEQRALRALSVRWWTEKTRRPSNSSTLELSVTWVSNSISRIFKCLSSCLLSTPSFALLGLSNAALLFFYIHIWGTMKQLWGCHVSYSSIGCSMTGWCAYLSLAFEYSWSTQRSILSNYCSHKERKINKTTRSSSRCVNLSLFLWSWSSRACVAVSKFWKHYKCASALGTVQRIPDLKSRRAPLCEYYSLRAPCRFSRTSVRGWHQA